MQEEPNVRYGLTLEAIVGVLCFLLLPPVAMITLGELRYNVDYLEYGGTMVDVWKSMLYSATIVTILLVSGLHFTGRLNSDLSRIGSGAFVISISVLNLFCRLTDFNSEMDALGVELFWTDFMYWSSTHERLELVLLGIIIGIFVIKR